LFFFLSQNVMLELMLVMLGVGMEPSILCLVI
jgi:hypothetical protein